MLQNENILTLNDKILKNISENFSSLFLDLRHQVFVDPKHLNPNKNYHMEMKYRGKKNWKLNELRLIGILHWYMSDEIRFLLNLFLEDVWSEAILNYDLESLSDRLVEKEMILSSKQNCLGWIILQEEFNGNDFFGNILNKNHLNKIRTFKVSSFLVSDFVSSDKRYSGWCRGPKDKGAKSKATNPNEFIKDTLQIKALIEQELQFETKLRSFLKKIPELVA